MPTLVNLWETIKQMFPPRAKWGVDQIPDLSGKVALVTGEFFEYTTHCEGMLNDWSTYV